MIKILWSSIADFGVLWTAQRILYELTSRIGLLQLKFPKRHWSEKELLKWIKPGYPQDAFGYHEVSSIHDWSFAFGNKAATASAIKQSVAKEDLDKLIHESEEILDGKIAYFSGDKAKVFPEIGWHTNPFTEQSTKSSVHWSVIPTYSPNTGDVKYIWETGRFSFAYKIARAYYISGDEKLPEKFWEIAEDWIIENHPNSGPHWKDGQEIALRIMAWCFALNAFRNSPSSTPERVFKLVGAIAAQTSRIESGRRYAELQRNNHVISEGVGLWTVGLLFPELNDSKRWYERGKQIISDAADAQIAADGSYIQNSMNYHRVMLDHYLWVLSLARSFKCEIPVNLTSQVQKAAQFLYNFQDRKSGNVPNYGNNDGALVLPISTCDYLDYRPSLVTAFWLLNETRIYEKGPWEEHAIWLTGADILSATVKPLPQSSFAAKEGGYYAMRSDSGFAMVRCHSHKQRPGQADMLHMDLWHKGLNIALDPGTYRYYAEPPWNTGLSDTTAHNTISVNKTNQMKRGPRFMWFNWTQSKEITFKIAVDKSIEIFQGEHYGYETTKSKITHRRTIIRIENHTWLVIDDLIGSGRHEATLQWLLNSVDGEIQSSGDGSMLNLTLGAKFHSNFWGVEGAKSSLITTPEYQNTQGWWSPTYGILEPAVSFEVTGITEGPTRFATIFTFSDCDFVEIRQNRTKMQLNDHTEITVNYSQPSLLDTPIQVFVARADKSDSQLTSEASN